MQRSILNRLVLSKNKWSSWTINWLLNNANLTIKPFYLLIISPLFSHSLYEPPVTLPVLKNDLKEYFFEGENIASFVIYLSF